MPRSASGRPRVLGIVAASCALMFGFLWMLVALRWGPLIGADTDAVRSARDLTAHHRHFADVVRQVTDLGDWFVLNLVAVAAIAALTTRRQWGLALLIVVVRAGEDGLVSLVKVLQARPRPTAVAPLVTASGYSFPSGHSAGAAAMLGLLAVLVVRRSTRLGRIAFWGLMGLLIVGVAASRVLLGVHYPSDVAAGILAGASWLSACLYVAGRTDARQVTFADSLPDAP